MRVIKFYRTESGNCPVEDFLNDLSDKQSKKIAWTLRVVRDLGQVPTQYLKNSKARMIFEKFVQRLVTIRFGSLDSLTDRS